MAIPCGACCRRGCEIGDPERPDAGRMPASPRDVGQARFEELVRKRSGQGLTDEEADELGRFMAAVPSPPGVPLPSGAEPPVKRRTRLVRGLVVFTASALIVALITTLLARGGGRKFPDAIAGLRRNASPQVQTMLDDLKSRGSVGGDKPSAAFYGDPAGPGVLVAVYGVHLPDLGVAFDQIASGFSASSPSAVNLEAKVTGFDGPATIECAPYSARQSGYLCVWSDGQTVGLLASIEPISPEGLELATEVYDAVTHH